MYTRCTHCLKWFRIHADVLRAARGQVRCSHCGNGFDALLMLREDLPVEEIPPAIDPRLRIPLVDAPPPTAPAPAPPTSALKPVLETGMQPASIEAVQPEPADEPAGDRLQPADETPPADGAQASAPEIENLQAEIEAYTDDLASAMELDARRRAEIEALPEDEFEAHEDRTEPGLGDTLPEDTRADEPALEFEDIDEVPAPAARDLFAEIGEHTEHDEQAAANSTANAPLADTDSSYETTRPLQELDEIEVPAAPRRRRPSRILWGALSLLALLALGAELVHVNRQVLSMQPGIGPLIRKTYARLGLAIPPRIDLRALVINHTEVTSDPHDPAALVLAGMLVNHAAFAQPYPVLHVSLTNRWGEAVGERFFTADQYLRDRDSAGDYLPADTSAVLQIKLVDPGPDAVGFAVEPCEKAAHGNVCLSKLPHPQT